MNLIKCNCRSQIVEQGNVFAKKNKLYCTALFVCSLDNDAAYENQEIGDKRIVVISDVED